MSVVACVTQKTFIQQLLYKQMIHEEMEQNILQKHTNVNINRSEEGDDFQFKKDKSTIYGKKSIARKVSKIHLNSKLVF